MQNASEQFVRVGRRFGHSYFGMAFLHNVLWFNLHVKKALSLHIEGELCASLLSPGKIGEGRRNHQCTVTVIWPFLTWHDNSTHYGAVQLACVNGFGLIVGEVRASLLSPGIRRRHCRHTCCHSNLAILILTWHFDTIWCGATCLLKKVLALLWESSVRH